MWRPVPGLILLMCLPGSITFAGTSNFYRFDRAWGSFGSGPGQLSGPRGIAVSGTKVYVTDTDNDCICVFTRGGTYLESWGASGDAEDQFGRPWSVRLDGSGNIFISDCQKNHILKRSPAWANLAVFGTAGAGNMQMNWPQGMWIWLNRVYVADRFNNRIDIWDTDGNWINKVSLADTWALLEPGGICRDSAGNFYIADTGHGRIVKVNSGFVPQKQKTGFFFPYNVTVDRWDQLYVADTLNHRVVKLNTNLDVLGSFGGTGTDPGYFGTVTDVAVDNVGYVYAVDGDQHRIQRFRPNLPPTKPTSVKISPAVPADHRRLTATASGSTDPDSDGLSYHFSWQYSPDKTAWHDGGTGPRVEASATDVGEWWRVKARAWDGHDHGPWRVSTPVQIVADALAPSLSASVTSAPGGTIAVRLSLTAPMAVSCQLTNIAGRVVTTLPARDVEAGVSQFTLAAASDHGRKLPAGQYLLKVSALAGEGQYTSQILGVRVQ